MREIPYKEFSFRAHEKNSHTHHPNVCQFELTFKCDLHCTHCYSQCYNNRAYSKEELPTGEIKTILDKVHRARVLWLCFTGGDPLTREDFLEIYSYAKQKGLIVSIFTNGYSMSKKIVSAFKKSPPFVVEITLNAVSNKVFERISGVGGSLEEALEGIDMVLKADLPLKIKTQVTKQNIEELPKIKQFVEKLGLQFRPSAELHASLDGTTTPCALRITPAEVLKLDGKAEIDCLKTPGASQGLLYNCAITGGGGFYLDPLGNMFLCNLIRKPKINLLAHDVDDALKRLLPVVRNKKFISDSQCRNCNLRKWCLWCPGRAYLEMGSEEVPIPYYCQTTKMLYAQAVKQ